MVLFLLFLPMVAASLQITEVMPNPEGSDTAAKPHGEWVELYNAGSIPVNLSEYVLYDNVDTHELYLTNKSTATLFLEPGSYAIVYKNGDADFSLNNRNGDSVRLLRNHTVVDSMEYETTEEGVSWSRVGSTWVLTPPTPGSTNVAGCDVALSLYTDNAIYPTSPVPFRVRATHLMGEPQHVTVKGVIEDVFGSVVKEYSPWTSKKLVSSFTKTYSPRLARGTYQLRFWYDGLTCVDSNVEDNNVSMLITVNPEYRKTESQVSIENVYVGNDDAAAWGDQVRVRVVVYKGKETKKAGSLWVEKDGTKVSKTSSLLFENPFTAYTVTAPVFLEPNCNEKISDGTATVILDAFDVQDTVQVEIEGLREEHCQTVVEEKIVEKTIKVIEREEAVVTTPIVQDSVETTITGSVVVDHPGMVVYESSSHKAKKLIPLLLAVTFGLLCIVLLRNNP